MIGDWLAGKNKNKTDKKKIDKKSIVNSPNDSKSIDSKKTQNTDGKKESNSSDRKKQKLKEKEKGEENLKTNKKNYFSRKSKEKKATLDSNFSLSFCFFLSLLLDSFFPSVFWVFFESILLESLGEFTIFFLTVLFLFFPASQSPITSPTLLTSCVIISALQSGD